MDPNLIYTKTAAGEEAIQHRVRVIQRNVRMVLILVDGHSTVADMIRKTGNPQLTENALAELEEGGFIELAGDQRDSVWQETQKVAREIRSAANNKPEKNSPPIPEIHTRKEEQKGKYPDFRNEPVPPASNANIPSSEHPVFNTLSGDGFFTSQFFLEDVHLPSSPATEKPKRNPVVPHYPQFEEEASKTPAAKKDSAMERLRLLWPSTTDGEKKTTKEKPVKIKAIKRSEKKHHGNALGWPGTILSGILIMVIFGGLTAILFPYDAYIPEVESSMARAIGRPVKLGAMRVDFYPVAGLTLENVRTGEGPNEIRIGKIQLQPDVTTLLSPRKIIRQAVLSGLALPLDKAGDFPKIFETLTSPGNTVGIRQLAFRETDISFGEIRLKGMQSDMNLEREKGLLALDMRSPGENLHIVIKPAGQSVELTLEARGWYPREGSAFRVDSADLKGRLENGTLSIGDLELRLADGLIQGSAVIQGSAKPNIAGEFSFERINTSLLGEALGLGKKFSGDVFGKISFQSVADSWSAILPAAQATGDFNIQRGSFVGIDLAETVRRSPGTPVQGGTTTFEQLTGKVRLSPEKNQFSELQMNSGLIQSTGYVDAMPGNKLSGRLELQIKGSANQMRVPISVSGTLETLSALAGRY